MEWREFGIIEIVRGVVPKLLSLRMHSEIFRLETTPRVAAAYCFP